MGFPAAPPPRKVSSAHHQEQAFRLFDRALATQYVRQEILGIPGPLQKARDNTSPQRQHESGKDERRKQSQSQSPSNIMRPRMDLFHDVDNARVVAMFELPGVGKDQLSINLEGNSLIVAGERRRPVIRCQDSAVSCPTQDTPSESDAMQTDHAGPDGATAAPRAAPRIKYARQEMRFGRFMRTLQLAPEIKPSHISASLDDGMLIITWPAPRASSVPPAQTPTRIEIA